MRSFDDGTSFFLVHPVQEYLSEMSFFLVSCKRWISIFPVNPTIQSEMNEHYLRNHTSRVVVII